MNFRKSGKITQIFQQASFELQQQEGFFDVVKPAYNTETHYLGEIYFDDVNSVFTYPVIAYTQEQIDSKEEERLLIADHHFDEQAAKNLIKKLIEPVINNEAELSSQDIEDAKMLYKHYRVGVIYDKDSDNIDERRFIWDNKLYKVIGARHTSQADWTPDTAVSLYTEIVPPGTIVEWNTDDYASYEIGTKVTWNGNTYQCVNTAYAWIEPGSQDGYNGWKEV